MFFFTLGLGADVGCRLPSSRSAGGLREIEQQVKKLDAILTSRTLDNQRSSTKGRNRSITAVFGGGERRRSASNQAAEASFTKRAGLAEVKEEKKSTIGRSPDTVSVPGHGVCRPNGGETGPRAGAPLCLSTLRRPDFWLPGRSPVSAPPLASPRCSNGCCWTTRQRRARELC